VGVRAVESPVRVILITDGDKVARRALESAAGRLGLRCISASAGNPTPLSGPELVALIQEAAYDPVLVMVDDKGNPGQGPGETALAFICTSADVTVLGAIAVASNTRRAKGTLVDVSITRDGKVIDTPVDKNGFPEPQRDLLRGDTVDVLRDLNVPVIVGIGDPGKMLGADCLERGSEVTLKAIMEVLSRTVGQIPTDLGRPAGEPPQ
jgi:stage V sporulation protein AE